MNQSLSSKLPFSLGVVVAMIIFASACHHPATDCIEEGTCECIDEQQCPEGEHCVDGNCRKVTTSDLPQRFFAEPCLSDAQCFSGLCLPQGPGNGGVCTIECNEKPCPEGWECKTHLDETKKTSLCVQRIGSRLCQPCSVSSQCNAIGDICFELAGEFVCGTDCSNSPCPDKYTCQKVEVAQGSVMQCIPDGGSCNCTNSTIGLKRACATSNEYGTCLGEQQCLDTVPTPDWGPCDARIPTRETCNGVDDDCDGLTDDQDPGIDTSGLSEDPPYPNCKNGSDDSQCMGRWHCQPDPVQGWAWVCGATDPQNETCNGIDDNCDGIADDPFIDAMGRYITTENCGACGTNCVELLHHLRSDSAGQVLPSAAVCQIRDDNPTCVPLLCEPGFYPYPENKPSACAPLVSPACQPCSNDTDCRISSDKCIALPGEPGGFCAQSCDPGSPYFGCRAEQGTQDCCPADYTCSLNQGLYLCMPDSGSCTCDQDHLGQNRTCLISGAAGQLCQGKQTCQVSDGDYTWGLCEQSDVVVEVCDYLDNDCDGQVDEDFVDESGNYFTDENCGSCNVNCLARWDRDIQHAIGGCVQNDSFQCHIVACTTETKPAAVPCRSDDDCAATSHCDQVLWMCALDVPGQCSGDDCGIPCNDDTTCETAYGQGATCDLSSNSCQVTFQFNDANELEVDGCECAQKLNGPPDEPDVSSDYPIPGMNYTDTDCDGIDGQGASSIFVWSGSGSSQGTRSAPYKTITEALDAFDPARHSAILVASGVYHEDVTLQAGTKLYGGYHPDFSTRDVVLFPSMIIGIQPTDGNALSAPGTINAIDIHTRTVLSGFVIQGYDVTTLAQPGHEASSSYAVYIKDCDSSLEISNNWILGGKGGDGADGMPGTSGENGENGYDGNQSIQCPNSPDCVGQNNPGGQGGANQHCPSAQGRPGATARGTEYDPQDYQGGGLDGLGGYNSTYVNDGIDQTLCKYDCQVGMQDSNNGTDARAGQAGPPGSPGLGCQLATGSVSSGRWIPSSSSPGGQGQAGDGGGGGGAGGAVYNDNFYDNPPCTEGQPWADLGGSGGGGGAGGCGGQGGQAGGSAGGSFGVFIVFSSSPASTPKIFGNLIRRGFGGSGGDGGSAALGGLGGQGGYGGNIVWPAWCAGAGGRGGRGGNGGAGGGGGGGCGGVSYAIAGQYLQQAGYTSVNTFANPGTPDTGGPGGQGGPSPAGPQAAGTPGTRGSSGNLGTF